MKLLTFSRKYWRESILVFFVLVTRIPFRTHYLYTWDSVQFALGLEHFDIASHQPHPPGYILYVALGKVFASLFGDANTGFVAMGIIATTLAGILFFRIVKELFSNDRFAFLSSLALLSLPAVWFYGEIAVTYIFDLLFSLVFAYCTLRFFVTSRKKYLFLLVFFFALSGGIRQSAMVLFAPLVIFTMGVAIARKALTIRDILLLAVVGTLVMGVWFAPLVILAGGLKEYLHVSDMLFSLVSATTSVFSGAPASLIAAQIKTFFRILLAALSAMILLPFLAVPFVRRVIEWARLQPLVFMVLIVWIAPSVFMYSFVHLGQAGYVMTLVGACMLVSTIFAFHIPYRTVVLTTLIVAQSLFFLLADKPILEPLKRISWFYGLFTRHELVANDRHLASVISAIAAHDPATAIVITERSFPFREREGAPLLKNTKNYMRHTAYYLPTHDVYDLFWQQKKFAHMKQHSPYHVKNGNTISLSPTVQSLFIVTDQIDFEEKERSHIQTTVLLSGKKLYHIDFGEASTVTYAGYTFKK